MPGLKRLGFLASGRGSNLQAVIDACESGQLNATPVMVISNNPDARALERGRRHGLLCRHLSSRTHPEPDQLDEAITAAFQAQAVDLIVLAGYMKMIGPRLLAAYPDQIINIHPSLLPRHGGRGMYGMHVHEAVLAAGDTETGVTVHLVNDEYDRGRILAQARIAVEPGDDAKSLAKRVLQVEHRLYVQVLDRIITGEIRLSGTGPAGE